MRWLGLVVVTASAMACADSPVAPTGAVAQASPIAGAYGLATLNGSVMPQILGNDGIGSVEVLSGTIKLNGDGSYFDILTFRRRGASVQIQVDTIRGGYVRFERTLLMQPANGDYAAFFEIRDDHTLAAANPGFYLVYRRD